MKIFLETIGCRLNQSEIEKFALELRNFGHIIVANPSEADIAIVNTCAVTAAASADSRKVIRRIAKSGCPEIIGTGCYTTIDPQTVSALPSVVNLYKNDEKRAIVSQLQNTKSPDYKKQLLRKPLPGKRRRTRAFIKVQDGCDNFCTFCITRIARGRNRSQPKSEIFTDIEAALLGGVKEIVLTGVNIGAWGKDLDEEITLVDLISQIIKNYSPPRIRLSSLEPWDINESFIPIFNHPSFCRHLHLPLQSGSDAILKKMGRRMLTRGYEKLIEMIRKNINGIAITTDLMVGFPGETDSDFEESINFVEQVQFAGGHVFRYSPRPGTQAEKMGNRVSERIKKIRSEEMRAVISGSELLYKNQFMNKEVTVLWERSEMEEDNKYRLSGISGNYLKVNATSRSDLHNNLSKVFLRSIREDHMVGEIVS